MRLNILILPLLFCSFNCLSCFAFPGDTELESSDFLDDTRFANAALGEAPHVVRVSVLGYAICAGSIVAPTWILVPAKCIQPQNLLLYSVVAGDVHSNRTEESTQRRSVSYFIRSNQSSVLTDVALFKIYPAFNFSLYVQPVALPPPGFDLPQATYDVYQWKFHPVSDSPDHWYTLSRVQILSLPYSECESMSSVTEELHICTKAVGDWIKNCPQEDGASLMFRTRRTSFLGGIYIYSKSRCTVQDDPSAFIRISPLTQWIRGVIA